MSLNCSYDQVLRPKIGRVVRGGIFATDGSGEFTRSPFSRMASRCGPRTTTDVSTPPDARRAAITPQQRQRRRHTPSFLTFFEMLDQCASRFRTDGVDLITGSLRQTLSSQATRGHVNRRFGLLASRQDRRKRDSSDGRRA